VKYGLQISKLLREAASYRESVRCWQKKSLDDFKLQLVEVHLNCPAIQRVPHWGGELRVLFKERRKRFYFLSWKRHMEGGILGN